MKILKNECDNSVSFQPLNGEIKVSNIAEFRRKFENEIKKNEYACFKNIIIDLSTIDFIDSSGIGALFSINKVVGDQGQNLKLKVSEYVMTILKTTRLDTYFCIIS
jgi:anti-sigma B factor antagonist